MKLESLTSGSQKFSVNTLSMTAMRDHKLYVTDSCMQLNYSYYLTTTNSMDAASVIFTSFFDMIATLITGAVEDRLE